MTTSERASDSRSDASKSLTKRSGRIRWSLRALIAVVTVTCLLLAWGAHRYRVGRIHEDVGKQLAVIVESNTNTSWRSSRIHVNWKYQETVRKKLPVVYKGPVAISGATSTAEKVKMTPKWMNHLGLSLMFQRIESIRIPSLLPLDRLDALAQPLARLDGQVPISIDLQQMQQKQIEEIFSKLPLQNVTARFAKLEPGPLLFLKDSGLVELCLAHTWFSDAAVYDLPETLESLDLERTAVTDAALPEIERLYRLKSLNLRRTPTSEAAIDQLREQMPWCKIAWEPLVYP